MFVIDVGNTSITWGHWKNDRLIRRGNHPTAQAASFKLKTDENPVIYASVVPKIDKIIAGKFQKNLFHQITYRDIPFISIALPNKKEIGIDRLVNAVGAVQLYSTPCIIIDFGTATTFCIVDHNNVYHGGLICPGINLTRTVLHEKTAKLPLIDITKKPKVLVGRNTIEAMQSGIFFGYQSLVEGILYRLKKQMAQATVIATGGYARLICQDLNESIDIIDPDLTLKSLRIIGKYILSSRSS
jgi:type III pantothenate kinase